MKTTLLRKPDDWRGVVWLLWLIGVALAVVSLRQAPFSQVFELLSGLHVSQISTLVLVNLLVLLVFAGRWWLLVKKLGGEASLSAIFSYRLMAFGVNYFTPGPQFGGEPLQVLLLHRRNNLDYSPAAASVALDKLLELAVNLGFLVWGGTLIASQGLLKGLSTPANLWWAVGLLLLPLTYLALLMGGKLPLSFMLNLLPQKWVIHKSIQRLSHFVNASESQASRFCRQQPFAFTLATALSLFGWALMILEFWLSLQFLGIHAGFFQTIAILVAIRMAFLSPTPAGLGVLEIFLTVAVASLGFGPVAGLGLLVLIRFRDICLGLIGLLLTARFLPGLRPNTQTDVVV
jgi:uncharacterized protein (TIRG00374 family)